MDWNLKVIDFGNGNKGIYEIYYEENGKIAGYCDSTVIWNEDYDDEQSPYHQLDLLKSALESKPLTQDDFPFPLSKVEPDILQVINFMDKDNVIKVRKFENWLKDTLKENN